MLNSRTIADIFDDRCAREGSRVAIREGDHELNFRELLRWSREISRALEPFIHEPGQSAALMLPNSAAFVAAFYAIARVGGVVAPLAMQYRSQELAYYLNDLEPVAFLTDSTAVERVLAVMPRLEIQPALLEVAVGQGTRLVRTPRGNGRPVSSVATPLLQLYTSGSTGRPKRVVRTHAALGAELEALRDTFEIGPSDKFLGATPFSHVNGLVRTMMTSMYVGATLYPVGEFRRREILDLMTREGITFFGGVSQMFTILAQTPLRGHVDLSSLRVVFSSSAPLLAADNRAFQARYGMFIRQLYGSTETGTISFNRDPAPENCLASVGAPIEGVRVEVVDEQGNPLPAGREGELVIASPFAASGYLNNATATNESFRAGCYFSGDLGIKDTRGYLTLTGRKKLLMNRGGFKVNPYEVEAAIKEHPKVVDVAVFGAPGPHGDDIICGCIVTSETCTVDEIVAHCRERIADFKIPTRIEFRDALPRSPTGKILRAKL
jgi:long-chain acyl-CoA synthetase